MRSEKWWILAPAVPVIQYTACYLSSPMLALPSHQMLNHCFRPWLGISTTPIKKLSILFYKYYCICQFCNIKEVWRQPTNSGWRKLHSNATHTCGLRHLLRPPKWNLIYWVPNQLCFFTLGCATKDKTDLLHFSDKELLNTKYWQATW